MFFDHYPYTNFHNVNLDWVLQAVKAWGQTVEANDQAFQDLEAANESFKTYVTNYLQVLDVSEEINDKLDQMLASGVLTPYFAPYVQGYVNSWLNSHVTPTSPALDNTLTLSGGAARADATGKRLKDLAYIDALSTPEVIAALNRSQVLPGYRVQGITYDYDGHYYVCGGSVDEDGTGVIVKMTKPDFSDAEISVIPQLGHANDITYYDGYLYVCTVGGGDAPQWGIYKINVNDFTDKTLISNAPENTIGISYRQGDFWILAPYRIYRTTDFTSYEVVVANTNDLLTAYGIPTSDRISQTIFRAGGYLIGWVCSFVFENRHYGALTFFNATGEPVAFKMFPAYHSEIQGAVYADMSIYLIADGNMVNIFRMDPRHLSYVQLKAGDDLNDFTGRGTLYSTGSNVSSELVNSPSAGEGFTVQVDRLGVYNTIQTARTNSGRELYRVKSFSSGTWGEWIEPAAEVAEIKDDLTTLSDLNSTLVRSLFTANKSGGGVDFTYIPEDGSFNVTTETVVTNKNNAWKNLLAASNDLFGMIPGGTYFCEIEKSGEGSETVNVWWKFYRDGVQDGNSHALYDSGFIIIDEWASGIVLRLAASTNGVALNCNIKIRLERYMSNRALQGDVTVISDKLAGIQPNLNILTLGDSIALGTRNGNRGFVGDLGMSYVNIGVSGASISTVRTDYKNVFTQLIDYQSANPTYNPDCIVADGGINDYISGAQMGTIPTVPVMNDTEAEALDKSTLMGATGYLFYQMIKLYPRAQRYFVIVHKIKRGENNVYYPTHTRPGIEYTQEDMHDALVKICGVYGVKVIDVYKDSMLNTAFSQYVSPTAYSADPSVTDLYFTDTDGLHPLALGYKEAYVPLVKIALFGATKK